MEEFLEIARIQHLVLLKGWRWKEEMFTGPKDCIVELTQDQGVHAFSEPERWEVEMYGWGRFPRIECWRRIEKFVTRWESIAAHKAAGSPMNWE